MVFYPRKERFFLIRHEAAQPLDQRTVFADQVVLPAFFHHGNTMPEVINRFVSRGDCQLAIQADIPIQFIRGLHHSPVINKFTDKTVSRW